MDKAGDLCELDGLELDEVISDSGKALVDAATDLGQKIFVATLLSVFNLHHVVLNASDLLRVELSKEGGNLAKHVTFIIFSAGLSKEGLKLVNLFVVELSANHIVQSIPSGPAPTCNVTAHIFSSLTGGGIKYGITHTHNATTKGLAPSGKGLTPTRNATGKGLTPTRNATGNGLAPTRNGPAQVLSSLAGSGIEGTAHGISSCCRSFTGGIIDDAFFACRLPI